MRGLVGQLVRQLPVPAEGVDEGTQFDLVRVRDGFTHLQADGECQFLAPFLEHIGHPQQHPPPLGRRQARPRAGVEGTTGGSHGRLHLGGASVGDLGQHLAVTGRDGGEDRAATTLVGAVDVMGAGQVQGLGAALPLLVGDVQHAETSWSLFESKR